MNIDNFLELIKKYNICIPIIQRDYVQGRENRSAKNIIERFLDNIFDVLTDKNSEKQLSLDFIYGDLKLNDTIFEPIDGQQRLTTMYLVAIYILAKENEDELSKLRKLTYKVRNTSSNFCEILRSNIKELIHQSFDYNNIEMKNIILNQKWYNGAWEKDQTIQSMINVLNLIDKKYKEFISVEQLNMYKNLKNIKLLFVNTKELKLDDDTYIKLNSRGLPLSNYEKFKSSLLDFEDFNIKFSKKVNTTWNDWMWRYVKNNYDKDNSIFDNSFYRLLVLSLFLLFMENVEIKSKDEETSIKELTENPLYFDDFKRNMPENFSDKIVNLGKIVDFIVENDEKISRNRDYIDIYENIFGKKFQENDEKKDKIENNSYSLETNIGKFTTYTERCEFYAVCLYALGNESLDEENFKQWTRFARNIISRHLNSNKESCDTMKLLKDIFNTVNNSDKCYLEVISDLKIEEITTKTDMVERLQKEKEKANKMLENSDYNWKKEIEELDRNKFLSGSTYYLIDFSKGINDKFDKYLDINNIVLDNEGKGIDDNLEYCNFKDYEVNNDNYKLFTRALLLISKIEDGENSKDKHGYLLGIGDSKKGHYSFLLNRSDRDFGFNKIFDDSEKSKYIQKLYDKILDEYSKINDKQGKIALTVELVSEILKKIIADNCSQITSWHKYFIKDSSIYTLLNNKHNLLKITQEGDVFILNGRVDSSNSIPLFFIALDQKVKAYNNENPDNKILLTSNDKELSNAWTTGLDTDFDNKKIINKINELEKAYIGMKKKDGIFSYHKSGIDSQIALNKILNDIESEFGIHFVTDF